MQTNVKSTGKLSTHPITRFILFLGEPSKLIFVQSWDFVPTRGAGVWPNPNFLKPQPYMAQLLCWNTANIYDLLKCFFFSWTIFAVFSFHYHYSSLQICLATAKVIDKLFPRKNTVYQNLNAPTLFELKILPSAAREEDEPLKTAGPRLGTSLLTLDKGWMFDPLLRLPKELPTEESLEPGLKVFGEGGSTELPLNILCSLFFWLFDPRLITCGEEGSAEPFLNDLR